MTSTSTGGSLHPDERSESDPPTGNPTAYRERLLPSAWVWCVGALLAALACLVVYPFGVGAAVAAAPVALALVTGALIMWSPVVAVSDGEFVAGRAHVPVQLLGAIVPLDAGTMRAELGPRLDVRAYLCIRGWIRVGIRVELVDPDDPTPYWLVSSRHPDALAAALERVRDLG